MTKPLLTIAASAVLLSAALLAHTTGNPHPEGQSGPVLGKPLSATEVRRTVQTLCDGTHLERSDTSVFYRDDRGRMRMESPTKYAVIYDPVSGFTYTLDLRTKTYRKMHIPAKASTSIAVTADGTWIKAGKGHDSPVRSITEDLPPKVINGINVQGSRITMTIPAGTIGNDHDIKVIHERWYSDDLKVLLKSSNSDPRFGVTTYELTNLVQAPPDPKRFQVPADYRERREEAVAPVEAAIPAHLARWTVNWTAAPAPFASSSVPF